MNHPARNFGYLLVMMTVLVIMYYPGYAQHIGTAAQATYFSDDARQFVWPFLQYYDDYPGTDDYISDYILSLTPKGYEWLYRGSAGLVDPRVTSKILPYILFAITLVFAAATAWRLAGPVGAWAALALCLSNASYMANSVGGLPRSFGYAFIAAALYALVRSRPAMLAVITVLAAAFYPPVAVLCGITLALFLLLPGRLGGIAQPWSAGRRVAVLAVAGICTVGAVLPTLVDLSAYGERIDANDTQQLAEFPEKLGRHPLVPSREVSWRSVLSAPVRYAEESLTAKRNPWNARIQVGSEKYRKILYSAVFLLILTGIAILWRQDAGVRRFVIMAIGVLAASSLAVLLNPQLYYPSRYAIYAVPVMMAIALPVALSGTGRILARGPFATRMTVPVLIIAGTSMILLLLGGRGPLREGYSVEIPADELPVYEFIETLPATSLLAGWPTDEIVQNTPYLTGRMVLLNQETHLVFHRAYALEMRRRANAVIAAVLSATADGLADLRDRFGVTHLVVRRAYFEPGGMPGYFAPFDREIEGRAGQITQPGAAAVLQQEQARVYDHNGILILELDRLIPEGE